MVKPDSAQSSKGKSRKKTDAPGQALGYSLQYTRLTQMVLEAAEGTSCSLEYLEDVAAQRSDGRAHLVQSKSALTANPVSNRAKSLWKTFATWLAWDGTAGHSAADTIFEIYVSRPVEGSIVDSFHGATTIDSARSAVAAARKELWGDAPVYNLRKELAPDVADLVNAVLGADDAALLPIVRNFRLKCGSGHPSDDLLTLIRTHPVPPSKAVLIADYICGVVKRRIDALLEEARPAVLRRDDIHALYRAFCRKVDSDTVLTSYAKRPTKAEALRSMPKTFVLQLDLIGLDYSEKIEAINDFLMASADRTEWATRGDVDESSFDDLDDKLKRSWKNRRDRVRIQHKALASEEQGILLLRDCLETQSPLQTKDTPAHYIPGCLHRLADELVIGWHPSFDDLLKVKKAA